MGGQADFKGNDTIKFLSHVQNTNGTNTWDFINNATLNKPRCFNVLKLVSSTSQYPMYYCDVDQLNQIKDISFSDLSLHQQSSTGLNVGSILTDTFKFSITDKRGTSASKALFQNIKNTKECSFGMSRYFEGFAPDSSSFTIDLTSNSFNWKGTNQTYTTRYVKACCGTLNTSGIVKIHSIREVSQLDKICVLLKNNNILPLERQMYVARMNTSLPHIDEQSFFNDVNQFITYDEGFRGITGGSFFVSFIMEILQFNQQTQETEVVHTAHFTFVIDNTADKVHFRVYPFHINIYDYEQEENLLELIFSDSTDPFTDSISHFRFSGSVYYPFHTQSVQQNKNKLTLTFCDTLRYILDKENKPVIDLSWLEHQDFVGQYTRFNSALNGCYNVQGYLLSEQAYINNEQKKKRYFDDNFVTFGSGSSAVTVNMSAFNTAYTLKNKGMQCLAFSPMGRYYTNPQATGEMDADLFEIMRYKDENKPICFRNWFNSKIKDNSHSTHDYRGISDFYICGHPVTEIDIYEDSQANPIYLSNLKILYLDNGDNSPSIDSQAAMYLSNDMNVSQYNGIQWKYSNDYDTMLNVEYQSKSKMKHCIATSIYNDTAYARKRSNLRSAEVPYDLYFYEPLSSEEILKRISVQYFTNVRLDWENIDGEGLCKLEFITPTNEWIYRGSSSNPKSPPQDARDFQIHNLTIPEFSGLQTNIGLDPYLSSRLTANGLVATTYTITNGTTSFTRKFSGNVGSSNFEAVDVKAQSSIINPTQTLFIRDRIATCDNDRYLKRYNPIQHSFLMLECDNPLNHSNSSTNWLKQEDGFKIQLRSNLIYFIGLNSQSLPEFYNIQPDFQITKSGTRYDIVTSNVTDITYDFGLDCKVTLAPTKITTTTKQSVDEAIFNASQANKQYVDSQIQAGLNTGALTVLDSNGIRLKTNSNAADVFGEINSTSATLPATNINGNTQVTGTFKATGTSTLQTVEATNIAGSGTLTMTGASTLNGGLTVSGNSTLGPLSCGNITSSGGASIRQTFITNGQSQMNGPVSMGSTLGVDGATVLRSGVETSWGTNAYYHEITQPSGSDAYKLKVIPLTNGFCQIAGWVHSSSQTTAGERTIKLPFTVNTIVNVNFTPSWTPGGGRQSYIPNYNITTDYYTGAEKDSFPYKFFLDGSLSAEQCYFYFSIMCKVT